MTLASQIAATLAFGLKPASAPSSAPAVCFLGVATILQALIASAPGRSAIAATRRLLFTRSSARPDRPNGMRRRAVAPHRIKRLPLFLERKGFEFAGVRRIDQNAVHQLLFL